MNRLPGRYLRKLPPDPVSAFLLGLWVGGSTVALVLSLRDILEIVGK